MSRQDRGQLPPAEQEVARFTALGQIAGELIHDLANVTAVVQGRAALALGDARTGRTATAELERLLEASEDLGVMLRDVLEILRGRQLSPEVRFDPVQTIERTVRRFLDVAPPIEIRMISSLPNGLQVAGRASFLARSILNLLNNAARFARSEIRLTLSLVEDRAAELVVLIEDDGPGLSPAMLANLFRPFQRSDADSSTGLGLSSVSWAVQQLRGQVRYRSDALLGGAAFEVRLPAILAAAPGPRDSSELLRGRRLAILVDDALTRRSLRECLEKAGARLTVFDPTGEAEEDILRKLLAAVPDAILVDVRLGTREGSELWRALQRLLPALARRVVFLSSHTPGDPGWDQPIRTGQPVLAKPLDVAELCRAIDGLPHRDSPR